LHETKKEVDLLKKSLEEDIHYLRDMTSEESESLQEGLVGIHTDEGGSVEPSAASSA
jgi:hypothetical protein